MVWGMDGKLYTLCISLGLIALSISTDTFHNFAVLLLHPWRMGGLLVVMAIVPSLWMVPPSLFRWKTIVYPASDVLFTLRRDCFCPGSTSTSYAAFDSWSKGSLVFFSCS